MAGQPIVRTPGEFALLAVMASQPGRVFSRQQLLALTTGRATRRAARRGAPWPRAPVRARPPVPPCLKAR
ncbi:winged helix-turn-helix domain-containing protein [Streptomyces sp.]|uniref:winged helix-turn-helix domain-containing protein n=1 Tax=Streptomyces sp. TaxID=1931 RepID=UPI0039C9051C